MTQILEQLSALTPLEVLLLLILAAGVVFFFLACWRNIKRGHKERTH